jgi:hypothetical protein
VTQFEEYLQAAGIVKELNWAAGQFPEEPSDYYVMVPDRGRGTKIPGCAVDEAYGRILQEFLDKYGDRYRVMADVVRAALVHFTTTIIVPGMVGQAKQRARGLAMMHRLKAQRHQSVNDRKMLADCEELFASSKAEWEKREPLAALDAYISGMLIPEQQEGLIAAAEANEVFGEAYRTYREEVRNKPIPGQEPYLDKNGGDDE